MAKNASTTTRGTYGSSPKSTTRKPVSKAAVRRRMSALQADVNAPPELSVEFQTLIAQYHSTVIPPDVLDVLRPTIADVMARSKIEDRGRFENTLTSLSRYLAWRMSLGLSFTRADAMSFAAIDDFCSAVVDAVKPSTLNDYRSRLRMVAAESNPGHLNPTTGFVEGYRRVRPGYSAIEEASIRRVALRQQSPLKRRQLCTIVGLCGGCGLDARDLRHVERAHIDDRGEDGIWVTVVGARPRVVVVRRDYEDLVRIAISGLSSHQVLLGQKQTRKNRVGDITLTVQNYDAPAIEAARLRTTWLAWLLTRPVPLAVVMQASGLSSARTLSDVIDHLEPVVVDLAILRGGAK